MNLTPTFIIEPKFARCGQGCGQTESTAEISNFAEGKSTYSPQNQKKLRTEIGAELVGEGGFEPPKL